MTTNYENLPDSRFGLEPVSGFDNRHSGERSNRSSQPSGENTSTESQPGEDSGPGASDPRGPRASDPRPDPEGETETKLPLDQVFEILKNRRRRLVLHYLEDNGGESTLSDLAEHIAAIENDTTVKAISSTQRKRVYVGLYQCHLPKMDDMDIIEFDQNRGTVVLSSNAEQVKSYLGEPEEGTWHRVYLGITLGGAGLFALSRLGGQGVGLTPTVVLLALLLGVATVGVVQAYGLDGLSLEELT